MADAEPGSLRRARVFRVLYLAAIAIGLFMLLCLVVLLILARPLIEDHFLRNREMQAAANMVEIQRALDEFAADHHYFYPLSIDALIEGEYLDSVPINPCTSEPVRFVQAGDTIEAGDIAYVPTEIDESGVGADGYLLAVFGAHSDHRYDGDRDPVLKRRPWIDAGRVISYFHRTSNPSLFVEEVQRGQRVDF